MSEPLSKLQTMLLGWETIIISRLSACKRGVLHACAHTYVTKEKRSLQHTEKRSLQYKESALSFMFCNAIAHLDDVREDFMKAQTAENLGRLLCAISGWFVEDEHEKLASYLKQHWPDLFAEAERSGYM